MTKRSREEDAESVLPRKRYRSTGSDRLSLLSDELLLRTLSYLSVSDLVLCQRLSRRLKSLASDSQLWKGLFYNRFVRPRASRIPGLRELGRSAESLFYSSKTSKWLEDDLLVKRGKATNWKRQYKLRHNWARGSAIVSETQVADQPSKPPLLVRLRDDIVVIAHATTGLRAWLLKGKDRLIAHLAITPKVPTSLAMDETNASADDIRVSVGFANGSFAIYNLMRGKRSFVPCYTHPPSTNGAILAMAYASPYLLTMTGEPLLSLYRVEASLKSFTGDHLEPPKLISSLRSHTAYPPISLALRASSAVVIASIAYATPTWATGWSVGLQEVRLTSQGTIIGSRMASALTEPSIALTSQHSSSATPPPGQQNYVTPRHGLNTVWLPPLTKPTSLSYNHPYLLSSHADNTLTLYMVTSNSEALSIGAGDRLWGHTSSVSSAHVGDRGKAVSVGTVGDELRVWELEGGLSSSASRKRAATGEASVQVRPEKQSIMQTPKLDEAETTGSLGILRSTSTVGQDLEEQNVTKGWVAFDEERVVLLREKMQGAQALVVYDFS